MVAHHRDPFAGVRAAESTTRYATTTAAVLAGQAPPDARPAAATWYEVRHRLQPFTNAAPLQLQDRDLGLLAQRAHSDLRREFGSPDQPQVRLHSGGRKVDAVRSLQSMVNEIPAVADPSRSPYSSWQTTALCRRSRRACRSGSNGSTSSWLAER